MQDYATQPISVCGKSFIGDQSGALIWPGQRTMIVADLHLQAMLHQDADIGGASPGGASPGEAINSITASGTSSVSATKVLESSPLANTRDTLLRLARLIDSHDIDTVIVLGNGFHDLVGTMRMSDDDQAILHILQEDRQWIWITGNSDPKFTARAGGMVRSHIEIEGLMFRHQPFRGPVTHEIAGHLHPAARLSLYGHTIRRACFVGNGRRLVLPAFGALTGGQNILDDGFESLFGHQGVSVWMLGEEGLYPIASRGLISD